MTSADKKKKKIIVAIFLGLVLWGLYLAVGAFYGPQNVPESLARALVVVICFALFLGFWSVLLLWFNYKKRRQQLTQQEPLRDEQAVAGRKENAKENAAE